METSQAFDKIFRKISTNKNYIEPKYPRMDNWSMDIWVEDGWFAQMTDAGYCRAVGMKVDGKVLWRVDEVYGKPYRFDSITEQEFQILVASL